MVVWVDVVDTVVVVDQDMEAAVEPVAEWEGAASSTSAMSVPKQTRSPIFPTSFVVTPATKRGVLTFVI